MEPIKDPKSGAAALGGIALIVFGLMFLVRSTGIIPARILGIIGDVAGALVLIGLGVVLIVLSRRGGVKLPPSGTRLYRSRSDRWLGGVLGGLGRYLNVDPLLLRIAVIILAVLGAGGLVIAYIVMWVIVPEEPFPSPVPPSSI